MNDIRWGTQLYSMIKTHNSWIILSKLMTANKRDAMAAPEIRERATMRTREAVLATVAGETFVGSE